MPSHVRLPGRRMLSRCVGRVRGIEDGGAVGHRGAYDGLSEHRRRCPQLRTAVADYLNRVRSPLAHPDHIVISARYAQGIPPLIQVLAAAGAKRLALSYFALKNLGGG